MNTEEKLEYLLYWEHSKRDVQDSSLVLPPPWIKGTKLTGSDGLITNSKSNVGVRGSLDHVSETFISATGGQTELKAKMRLNSGDRNSRKVEFSVWASVLCQCQGNIKKRVYSWDLNWRHLHRCNWGLWNSLEMPWLRRRPIPLIRDPLLETSRRDAYKTKLSYVRLFPKSPSSHQTTS